MGCLWCYVFTVYAVMRATNPKLVAQHPADPGRVTTPEEAAELQRKRNALGSKGIAEEKEAMRVYELRLVDPETVITDAQHAEYRRLAMRAKARSSSGICPAGYNTMQYNTPICSS